MVYILAILFAGIQYLRGWGPLDGIVNPKPWRKWANKLAGDIACSIYVVIVLSIAPAFVEGLEWWQGVVAGVLYGAAEAWIIKRLTFACYNGDTSEYDKNKNRAHKWPIAIMARIFKPLPKKTFATIYCTFAGLAYATMLLPYLSFNYDFIAAVGLCCTYGVVYYAMNLLPGKTENERGEAVARTIYGAILGLAVAAVL